MKTLCKVVTGTQPIFVFKIIYFVSKLFRDGNRNKMFVTNIDISKFKFRDRKFYFYINIVRV